MQVRVLPDSLTFDDIGREVNAGRPVWLLKVRGLPRPLLACFPFHVLAR